MQASVITFTLCVSLWVVCRCSGFFYTVQMTQLFYNISFKVSALVRMETLWWPKRENHSLTNILATVLAFWSLAGTAIVNLVKISVITKTFSMPLEAFSNNVKSIAITSNGFVAIRLPKGAFNGFCLATTHRSQFFTQFTIS